MDRREERREERENRRENSYDRRENTREERIREKREYDRSTRGTLASPSIRPIVRHRVEGRMRVHGTEYAGDTASRQTQTSQPGERGEDDVTLSLEYYTDFTHISTAPVKKTSHTECAVFKTNYSSVPVRSFASDALILYTVGRSCERTCVFIVCV